MLTAVILCVVLGLASGWLGDHCGSDGDCSGDVEHSICRDSVCVCGEDTVQDGDRCRPFPRLYQPCREDAECVHHMANAECAAGVCKCVAGFAGPQCSQPLVACSESSDCELLAPPVLSCQDGFCVKLLCTMRVSASKGVWYLVGGGTLGDACDAGRLLIVELLASRQSAFGIWQICDAGPWTDADAAVLCRPLGYLSGTAITDGRYGNGGYFQGRLAARVLNITCSGDEPSLDECNQEFVTETERGDGRCPDGTVPVMVECSGSQG